MAKNAELGTSLRGVLDHAKNRKMLANVMAVWSVENMVRAEERALTKIVSNSALSPRPRGEPCHLHHHATPRHY